MRIEINDNAKLNVEVYQITTYPNISSRHTNDGNIPLNIYTIELTTIVSGGYIPSFKLEGSEGYRNAGKNIAEVYVSNGDLTYTKIARYENGRAIKSISSDLQKIISQSDLPQLVKDTVGLTKKRQKFLPKNMSILVQS